METMYYEPVKKVSSAKLVEDVFFDVTYKFGYQLITAFQASFAIVLAFQVNDIVNLLILEEHISSRYAVVIPILILCNITSSFLKDKYVAIRTSQEKDKELSAKTSAKKGSTHQFFYRT